MAFQIIRHAFAMIFNNFGQALRVSVGPYLILLAAVLGLGVALGSNQSFLELAAGNASAADMTRFGDFAIGVIAILILALFISGWVAVSWHRFILLEEYTGLLPAVSGRPIWGYIGRTLLYGLLIMLVAFVLSMILALLLVPFAGGPADGPFVVGLFVGFLLVACLSYIWFRVGIALPSVAVGKPIGMREAWRASAKLSGTIFWIVIIIAVVSVIAGIGTQGLYGIHPVLGLAVDVFVQWLTLMVGVSILTTLYGHVIEGRPLID